MDLNGGLVPLIKSKGAKDRVRRPGMGGDGYRKTAASFGTKVIHQLESHGRMCHRTTAYPLGRIQSGGHRIKVGAP